MTTDLDNVGFDDISDAPPTIPPGDYVVRMMDTEVATKKDNSGKFIKFRVVVQGGPHAGYSIRGLYSLGPDQVWRLKRDIKALGLEITQGLSVAEAAAEFAESVNGVDVNAKIGTKVRQVKDDSGTYVADPDGALENTVQRILGVA